MSFNDRYRFILETKFNRFKFIGHSYHDYPEGEDLFGKLVFTTKVAAAAGWIYGIIKIMGPRPIEKYREMFLVCLRSTVPAVGMAATFTTATYYATNFRKKDDSYNYGIGSIAAAAFYGSFSRSIPNGIYLSVLFAAAGMTYKTLQMEGKLGFWEKQIPCKFLSPYSYNRLSCSIWPEKQGNWVAVTSEK